MRMNAIDDQTAFFPSLPWFTHHALSCDVSFGNLVPPLKTWSLAYCACRSFAAGIFKCKILPNGWHYASSRYRYTAEGQFFCTALKQQLQHRANCCVGFCFKVAKKTWFPGKQKGCFIRVKLRLSCFVKAFTTQLISSITQRIHKGQM